ncbi:MAG: cobaltochelatase subunit CobT, partial [Paracoccaceae bacterium]
MVSKSDNPADPFKKALAEATKVLADNPELSINYSVDPSGVSGDNIRLPQVSRRMTKEEVLLARGTADALAMHHKYHNSDLHSRFAPDGPMAREIYEAMETARCEAIGAKDMPGTTGNINAKIGVEAKRKGFDKLTDRADAPLADAAAYLIRTLTTKKDLPSSANNVLNLWKDFILDQAETTIENLTENLDNQERFAKFSRQIITDLGYGDQLGDEPEAEDDENQEQQDENEEQADDPESSGTDENNDETLDAEDQQSQDEQQDAAQAQMSSEDSSDEDFDDQ